MCAFPHIRPSSEFKKWEEDVKHMILGSFDGKNPYRIYWRWSTWHVWKWRCEAANGYARYFGPLSVFCLTEIIPFPELLRADRCYPARDGCDHNY